MFLPGLKAIGKLVKKTNPVAIANKGVKAISGRRPRPANGGSGILTRGIGMNKGLGDGM